MKKWKLVFLMVAVAITVVLYIFIPNRIVVHETVFIPISKAAIFRVLIENDKWNKGWSGTNEAITVENKGAAVTLNNNIYSLIDRTYGSLTISIINKNDTIGTSSLNAVSVAKDSVQLNWSAAIPTSYNPIKRLKIYQQAKNIEKDFSAMLDKMKTYFSNNDHIYGIKFYQEQVADSTLVSTFDSSKGYPKVEFIYSLIDKLNKYVASNNAASTAPPMLNIFTKDSINYITKVALPVNKKLPSSGNISYKWMLQGGNILVTDVKGGGYQIANALKQLEYYMKDYGRNSPAIPFLSLVTNRLQQKDSTQWITRIYYPVME